jgi:hypothetical protein
MRYIIALSVLGCLAASPAFAWGTGAGTSSGSASGTSTGNNTGDHGENDARGGFGNGTVGQVDAMRSDDELGCIEGTLTRCNK